GSKRASAAGCRRGRPRRSVAGARGAGLAGGPWRALDQEPQRPIDRPRDADAWCHDDGETLPDRAARDAQPGACAGQRDAVLPARHTEGLTQLRRAGAQLAVGYPAPPAPPPPPRPPPPPGAHPQPRPQAPHYTTPAEDRPLGV